MKNLAYLFIGALFLFFSCKKDKKGFPPEPQIYYESTNPNTIKVFDTNSRTLIRFHFEDGDGDLGVDPEDTLATIFVRDSRDTTDAELATFSFPFPYIPNSIRKGKAITGNVTMNFDFKFYQIWDSLHFALRKDTMVWSIYVQDAAGNKSNTIHSDTIYIDYNP